MCELGAHGAVHGLKLPVLAAALFWVFVPGLAAQEIATASNSRERAAVLQHRDARYRLCTSDVIALTFPLTPEFDQTVSIQPDGYASLAGAGDVHLEGLTTQESAAAVRSAYAKILHEPVVSIELKDYNKPYFVVMGQVNRPGKYDLRGETSATQAVAIAGGFNEAARHSQVLLFHRVDNDWYEVKNLNLKKILRGRDIREDAEIRPGDMVFVPQNFVSKVKRFIPSSGVGAYYQLRP
ncbi:MAG TPA: polysaccharide biosynthesis/export family protein [Candidatus Acidoferrales bacterium]|nr:polysaccharide biosynthesis/export family protein [Candidatus Acidoferrales bacterium]